MAKLSADDEERLQDLETRMQTMWLGVYGDATNEILGLIQTVRELKEYKQESKENWKKVIYFSAGASAVASGMVTAAVYIFKFITQ